MATNRHTGADGHRPPHEKTPGTGAIPADRWYQLRVARTPSFEQHSGKNDSSVGRNGRGEPRGEGNERRASPAERRAKRSSPVGRNGKRPSPGRDSGQERLEPGRPGTYPAARRHRPPYRIESFISRGVDLSYEIHGSGTANRTVVYLHGLLLDANLNRPLAQRLALAGNRVILLDLPCHGASAKPLDRQRHRMDSYATDAINLLDHLGIDRAVVGGVSLGANVALFAALAAPERIGGLIVEMPSLTHAIPTAAVTFVPMLAAMRYLEGPYSVLARLISMVPRTGFAPLDSFLNEASLDPRHALAVLEGLFMGASVPTPEQVTSIGAPTLVIGHRHDRIHPYADAVELAAGMPNARFLEAHSVLEMRVRGKRLTTEVAHWLDGLPGSGSRGAAPQSGSAAAAGTTEPGAGRSRQ